MTDIVTRIRGYWDHAAATYDQVPGHNPQTALEWAAWRGVLGRLLPPLPARVLDVGAGTGALSVAAAQLRYTVTAVDLAPAMLERLRANAAAEDLQVTTVTSRADEVPAGTWDAVMSRHLLWTLPDPLGALQCWRAAAPDARLLLLESMWGSAGGPVGRGRSRARDWLQELRGTRHGHDGHYDDAMRAALPLGGGTTPEGLVDLVTAAGWRCPRVERLVDIEWAMSRQLPMPDRLLGVNTSFAIVAG
ncbi:MAG TPA: class I SAM-dependent methyltransferase [Pseudonocardiaceae bacterium]|nr:class I SAM-dependent methyltransferase [Pseudonocardiaceae bacterium]